jgi:hypothetical protein
MLLSDKYNSYNASPSDNEFLIDSCTRWMDHYNFMMSIPWNTDADNSSFQTEFDQYKVYDV